MYKADFKWPGGAYIALVLNMSWESWDDTLGTAASTERSVRNPPPANAPYSRGMRTIYEHAFGDTGGMQRLLDMWRRKGITTSCFADGLTVSLFPELGREVVAEGHELLVQGWDHAPLTGLTIEEQAESIDRTVEVFDKQLGYRATGFSSSAGNLTAETFGLLAERGFKYVCGLRNADMPFIIPIGDNKLVGMVSYMLNDFPTYTVNMPLQDMMYRLKYEFDALYAEGERGWPKMLSYGTHPFTSQGFRTRALEEFIDYAQGHPKVWFTTRGEIASYMLETYPDYDLSKFYPEAVNSDRHYGLGIGLGGPEAKEKAARYRNR